MAQGDIFAEIQKAPGFVVIRCTLGTNVTSISWLIGDIAEAPSNNADIGVECGVYTGESIRVDIDTDFGDYNVYDANNLFLFAGILKHASYKKLGTL